MDRKDANAWVWSAIVGLLPSQINTLADLVGAARALARLSLCEIGRRLLGTFAKHGIKRCWRFTANPRIVISDAMEGVVRALLKGKRWRDKPLVVAIDWGEVRNFHTLMAAAVRQVRALPLLWASYPEWQLAKSQNSVSAR